MGTFSENVSLLSIQDRSSIKCSTSIEGAWLAMKFSGKGWNKHMAKRHVSCDTKKLMVEMWTRTSVQGFPDGRERVSRWIPGSQVPDAMPRPYVCLGELRSIGMRHGHW